MIGVAALIVLGILMQWHYTSWPLYWKNIAQPRKMAEMRDEQYRAVDDANHREDDDE